MHFEEIDLTPKSYDIYKKILVIALEHYSDSSFVTGIDIGYKYSKHEYTGDIAIRFHVRQKVPKPHLKNKSIEFPREIIEGIFTDVLEAPHVIPRRPAGTDHRREEYNPIQPGISIAHETQGPGTLGAVVFDHAEGRPRPAVLSAAHVLAPGTNGRNDYPIYQPGRIDGGEPEWDIIGSVENPEKNVIFDRGGDGAIAFLNGDRMIRLEQLEAGVVVTSAGWSTRLGEILRKSGRGSGVTSARVDGVGFYRIEVPDRPAQWMSGFLLLPEHDLFTDFPISEPGDSGAVWFRTLPGGFAQGVGLHIDGDRNPEQIEYAVACHLPRVLRALNVTLTPEDPRQEELARDPEPAPAAPGATLRNAPHQPQADQPNPDPVPTIPPDSAGASPIPGETGRDCDALEKFLKEVGESVEPTVRRGNVASTSSLDTADSTGNAMEEPTERSQGGSPNEDPNRAHSTAGQLTPEPASKRSRTRSPSPRKNSDASGKKTS